MLSPCDRDFPLHPQQPSCLSVCNDVSTWRPAVRQRTCGLHLRSVAICKCSLIYSSQYSLIWPCMRSSRGIYAGGTTENSTSFRYFVEYREPWGAKHAHALQLEDTIVHALESSPHLIEHFHAVSTPGLPPKPQAEVLQTARWTPYRKKKSRHAQQG